MIRLAEAAQAVQKISADHPSANWIIILGSALASWLAPIASLVAIVWGGLQIYTWVVNKRWRPRQQSKE